MLTVQGSQGQLANHVFGATTAVELYHQLKHPIRVSVLALMVHAGEPISPVEAQQALEIHSLGSVSYHFRRLLDGGWVELVRERRVRGAVEHFYRPTNKALSLLGPGQSSELDHETLVTLNALVTFALENLPAVSDEEWEAAKRLGRAVLGKAAT